MKHRWQFCDSKKIELRRDVTHFNPKRKNDKKLMECFINNGIYGYDLASINRCRLFRKVVYLSEITTGYGIYIARPLYYGIQNQWLMTIYEWPNQGKPVNHDWTEWRRVINSTFFVSLPSLVLPLSYQLREWDEDIPQSQWRWWYCAYESRLVYEIYFVLISYR